MKPTIFDTFSNRNANENILFELFVQKFFLIRIHEFKKTQI